MERSERKILKNKGVQRWVAETKLKLRIKTTLSTSSPFVQPTSIKAQGKRGKRQAKEKDSTEIVFKLKISFWISLHATVKRKEGRTLKEEGSKES